MRRDKLNYRSGEHSLTRGEYELLISTCNTLEEEVLLKLAVGLGLRRIDISKILLSNIDLENAEVTYIEHKKSKRDTKTGQIVVPKIRTAPLSPVLVQLLRKYLFTLPKGADYLFPWGPKRWGDRTAHRRLWALCDRAGVRRIEFHALRATCVKFCQQAGFTPEQTAALIGDSIRVVQEHYSTPSKAEMAETVKKKEIV